MMDVFCCKLATCHIMTTAPHAVLGLQKRSIAISLCACVRGRTIRNCGRSACNGSTAWGILTPGWSLMSTIALRLANKGAMTIHQRPSFEMKLCRNAWAAGAPPCRGSLQHSQDPLTRLRGPTSKAEGKEKRGGQGLKNPFLCPDGQVATGKGRLVQ